ncbi:hypothetical protein NC651_038431 [Populus alba x Populus x berolinensis]|nr:hypothetical protein NC651_038431 [Populus alba x Populus x berolinensis]
MACNHNRALNGKPNLLGPLSFSSIGRAAAFSVGLDILRIRFLCLSLAFLCCQGAVGVRGIVFLQASYKALLGGSFFGSAHIAISFFSYYNTRNSNLFLVRPSETCHYTFGYLLQQSYFVVVTRILICFVQLIVAPILF